MLLVDIGYDGIYLRNIFTEETWQIFDEHPDLPFTANFVAWGRAGCEVIVGPHLSVGGSLLRLDLKGNILQVIHSFANLNAVVTNVKLSPSKDKMAYEAVGREYHSEDGSYSGQFLEVIYLNTLSTPYVISERNAGEDTLAWSTDGEWLAYAEYDEKDVMQVHISRPDGNEQRQLTQFTDPNAELSSLEWSPDGQRIAFRFAPNPNASPDSAVTIVTVQDQQPQVEFVEIEGAGRISDFWWQNEEILVLSSGSIYWFEITDREVIDEL
jgi:hypothetical protein